jgi:carboxyl-terminal processing protease
LRDTRYAQDFDELWNTLRDRYCFFDGKAVDWLEVRSLYRPMALAAGSDAAFTDIVRRVLSELYDAHTHLADPPPGTPRWPLFDLLVERAGTDIRIAAIAPDSAAADAGLAVGDVITEVGGTPVEQVVRDAAPKCLTRPDHAADSYAINVAAAGRRGQTRHFAIRSQTAASRNVSLAVKQRPDAPNVQSQRIDEALGYIAIRSFADPTVVEAFDNALAGLRESRGLVIDVRQNGGGDTAVARPIMGRFLSEQKPYALMRRRERAGLSAPWREWVDPRGPFTYGGRVIVLVDPWSASLAEGFAMGMRGLERAMIVGTPMMGLGAAVFAIRLDRTGIQAQYSAEPVYDVTGQPRWTLRPDVNVPSGGDIMAAGIATARAQI